MTNPVSMHLWNAQAQQAEAHKLTMVFNITGAAASTEVQGFPVLTTYGAISTQATIDNFLGTTNEFLIAAFDATAMGADTIGGVINMKGQCKEVIAMEAKCYSATGGSTLVTRCVQDSATLTASTLATEIALGTSGNIGFKIDFGNTPDFDGLTAGTIIIEIIWKSK